MSTGISLEKLRAELRSVYAPPFNAPATWAIFRQVLDELDALGVRHVAEITPPIVSTWLASRPERNRQTQAKLLSVLRRICRYAKLRGWLEFSPFEFRRLESWLPRRLPATLDPALPQVARKHHSLESLRNVFDLLRQEAPTTWQRHRLYALAAATFFTGARAREIQCSRVADWDLETRLFAIRPNRYLRLKTAASARLVPIAPELVLILRDWVPHAGPEWMFPGATRSGPWLGGAPGYKPLDQLKKIGKRAGVDGLTFLSLRHSFITHAGLSFGLSDVTRRDIAGHTTAATTALYHHFDRAAMLAAADKIRLF